MANRNLLGGKILYTCEYHKTYGDEQVVPEHVLSYVISGSLEMQVQGEKTRLYAPSIGLARKNELVRAQKFPDTDGNPCKSISIFLDGETLRDYALENNIPQQERYTGKTIIDLSHNAFLEGYFSSLLPYFNEPEKLTDTMAKLKTREAIAMLLQHRPDLVGFLFDLSKPHKLDMEKYMKKNYIYNLPLVEFARLTGRSLSSFKRDFKAIFNTSPERWLRERRLAQAHYLLTEKGKKPSDIYYELGFENFSHFSHAFKQQYGYTASSMLE